MREYYQIINYVYRNADPAALEYGIDFAKRVLLYIGIAIGIIIVLSLYRIFKKAGEKGFIAFIPVYNVIKLYKISGINPLFILTFIIMFIPEIEIIGFMIWNIVDATQKALLARKFGKSIGFIVGIILLDFVFYPILALDKSEYKENV